MNSHLRSRTRPTRRLVESGLRLPTMGRRENMTPAPVSNPTQRSQWVSHPNNLEENVASSLLTTSPRKERLAVNLTERFLSTEIESPPRTRTGTPATRGMNKKSCNTPQRPSAKVRKPGSSGRIRCTSAAPSPESARNSSRIHLTSRLTDHAQLSSQGITAGPSRAAALRSRGTLSSSTECILSQQPSRSAISPMK